MMRSRQMVIRLTEREYDEFRRAAEAAGLPFSDWVRRRLTEAAEEEFRETTDRGQEPS